MKNEKPTRTKIISLSIIGCASLVAAFLVMNASKNGDGFLKMITGGLDDYRFAFSSGKEYQNVMESDNATDRFIQSYGSQIALKNPNGPDEETLTLPSQKIFDALLAKEVSLGVAYEAVSDGDMRVVSDSKENISSYLAAVKGAMTLRKTDLWKSLFAFSENGNDSALAAYATESNAVANKLLATPVPSSWKSFHIDLINFERKRATVVRAIAKSSEDPVKGIAAMEELENLNEAELKLAETFAEKVNGI